MRPFPLLVALRPYQWVKNILIFAPFICAHEYRNLWAWRQGFLAFVLFSLTASSIYLLNDLMDLEHDRLHDSKKHRPLAAGRLSPKSIAILWPLMLLGSLSMAYYCLNSAMWVLVAYAIGSLSYSFFLKKIIVFDVVALACFYAARVIMGAFSTQTPLSFWFLLFSLFIFLSLALAKRYSDKSLNGRGYLPEDMPIISQFGIASAYLSVMTLGLYVKEEALRYPHYLSPHWMGLVCIALLIWTTRLWFLVHRGAVSEDPVLWALKDPMSWITAFVLGFLLIF